MSVSVYLMLNPACVCARFLSFLASLCSIQRLKMRFVHKANELLLWAHFVSHSLFSLMLSNLLFQPICVLCTTPFLTYTQPPPFCQHLIHSAPLWGAAHTIKGFVGELSSSEGCSEPDQPPPEPQLASGD